MTVRSEVHFSQPSYEQHSTCTSAEREAALAVKELHDRIEVVAYRAFADIVQALGITGDRITSRQSGEILAYVKEQAHIELYRDNGYWKSRLAILNPSQVDLLIKEQFQVQINGLARLVHDRDGKLTDGCYRSLTDLLMAIDDHNYMVKENLLRSWFKCPSAVKDVAAPSREILEHAKGKAQFYEILDQQLNFDMQASLARRQAFMDRYFPGIREPEQGSEFVNTVQVRDFFGTDRQVRFNTSNPSARLVDVLPRSQVEALFDERTVRNLVRSKEKTLPALLSDRSMTVRDFMTKYFPEQFLENALSKPSACSSRAVLIGFSSLLVMIGFALAKASEGL